MKRLLLLLPLFLTFYAFGQVNYTANTIVTPYNGKFRLGINPGYYPGWDNQKLANISAGNPAIGQKGVGARANRVGLYENILDTYGYNVSMPDFLHYASLGMSENVAIIGGPSGAHQDYTQYCPGQPSALFSNLYEPIWDGGLNGTPYNDNNYFAAYMYKTVSQYKDHVRFWEIWNEPGLDITFNIGWRDENYPGNWWKEGPKPCEYVLKAPIYNYIRTLRIAWEVIKTVAPDDYVCLGSVGYQSFMNALLSNTDNPNNGDVSAAFPLTGGAYFDCITYHSYPHFDGSTTFLSNNFFQRHSDEAADGLVKYQAYYKVILDRYGYNGSSFPKKEWIVTEVNSPRKTFGEAFPGSGKGPFFGSVEAQINHIMKAFMVAKINKIHQLHTFELIDRKSDEAANYEFDLFGLYKTLNGAAPYNVQVNDEGKALKTMTDLVYDTEYDPVRTAALNLPSNIRGYAWKKPDGSYVYSLWAKTVNDLSENITANYTFPTNLNVNSLVKHSWDYGYTGSTSNIPSQNIALDARPIFLLAGAGTASCAISAQVSNYQCNNNSTPTVVADDTYTFSVTVSNSTGCGSSWTGGGATGSYGVAKTFGPYLISEGNKTLTFTDASNATSTATVRGDAPAPCSAIVVTCQNNILQNPGLESGLTGWEGKGEVGAPANSGTKTLKVCIAGEKAFQTRAAQAGKTYRLNVIAKKDVNTEGVIGFKFLSSSFIPLLHIYQGIPTNEYFTISKTGTAPAGTAYVEISLIKDDGLGCLYADDWCLSESGGDIPCALSATVSNVLCSDNGTSLNPADDTYTFNATVLSTGSCGKSWTGGGQADLYGVVKAFGPYPISGGNKTLTFSDVTSSNITTTVTATAPLPCSTTGGGTNAPDLELTLTADKTTPSIYTKLSYTLKVKNNGTQPLTNAVVKIEICPGANGITTISADNNVVYAGLPDAPTSGFYNYYTQVWTLTNLQPAKEETLIFSLFLLTGKELKVVAYCQSQSPNDADSQPAATAPVNCSPLQDDEALWTINAGQMLNPAEKELAINSLQQIVYPNPSNGTLFVTTKKPVRVKVYDQTGLLHKDFIVNNTDSKTPIERQNKEALSPITRQLDVSDMPEGLYFIRIETAGEQAVTRKVMIMRE